MFDRYLARLVRILGDAATLKGGLVLELRLERARTTRDGEESVRQEAWRSASLPCCPFHPEGGCGFARHTAYERVSPPGCLVARWYCPTAYTTISLLPDFLCSRS